MPGPKPIFTSPQEAEAAFYDALERADLEAMMSVWSEDDEIVCIQPGGARLTGYAAVRDAFRRIFQSSVRLRVRVSHQSTLQGPFSAIHSVIQRITVTGEEAARAPVVATNVYIRSAMGWRMIVHHASPVPADSAAEVPQTLH